MREDRPTPKKKPGRTPAGPVLTLVVVPLPEAKTDTAECTIKEWAPFLRTVEPRLPYVHHHWPPVRCRLLRTALAAGKTKLSPPKESQATRRMLIRMPMRVSSRYPPPLRVPRFRVTVWTTCGHSPRQWQCSYDPRMGDPARSNASLKRSPEPFHCQFLPTTPQPSPETIAVSAPELPLPLSAKLCGEGFGRHLSRSYAGGSPEWLSPSPLSHLLALDRGRPPASGACADLQDPWDPQVQYEKPAYNGRDL